MSDFDFGDALEDAIENRQNTAGFIFAQGAANQRAAQLKSLEEQLAVDKRRARTEKERLSVEKRRLEIEEERLVVERDAKISAEALATEIRFLRGIMVDIGDDLAAIRKGASSMLSGRLDQAITLRVAYVQVLLKLIGDRSHVLCDLGDLKEFRRLGSEFTQVSRECHQKGLSPGDPLQRVVDEIRNLDTWGAAAKALLDRARSMLRSDLFESGDLRAGLTKLAAIRVELEKFIRTFDGDVERVSRQLPLYCFNGQALNSSVGVIWELLHENTPWPTWFNPINESIQGLGGAKQWVDKARSQLAKIGPREALARAEANDLLVALDALAGGDPQKARTLSNRPISERFDGPLWGELESDLQKMEAAYADVYAIFIKGWDPFKMGRAIQSLRENVLWANVKPHSEWGAKLNAFELKARRYSARFHETVTVIIFLLVFAPALLTSLDYQRNKILAAARKKAEIESAQRVQMEAKREAQLRKLSMISEGTYIMGDESHSHMVAVSSFYMGRTEVTKEEWDLVRTWGLSCGYTDLAVGGGKASNHPVQEVTWWDVVKWCNASSEKDGFDPVYTVNGAVMRTGKIEPIVNWGANGYRLPTEAEWEKAARGGLNEERFPWGETISHSQANYESGTAFYYDVSPTRGFQPTYGLGSPPYTSPVGSFPANGYGLHDMAGNVREWCWDWFGVYASEEQSDPRGMISGKGRVLRGGGWDADSSDCRAADRGNSYPDDRGNNLGFRVVLGSVP